MSMKIELTTKEADLADALILMYEQYCQDGHHFMTAGENASEVLERYNLATFDEAGRIEKILKTDYEDLI